MKSYYRVRDVGKYSIVKRTFFGKLFYVCFTSRKEVSEYLLKHTNCELILNTSDQDEYLALFAELKDSGADIH